MKGRAAVFGVSVTMASYLIGRAVNLTITVILARALGPDDMGTIAFAFLAVELFDFLRDFGLRETLIYDRTEDPRLRNTAFIMILCVGLLQSVTLLLVAPFADGLVADPVIVPVLMTLAIQFPINALASVQDALHQRNFRFNTLALADILGISVKALVAFSMIYQGAGIWSIVVGMLIGSAVRVSVLWIASDWRPSGIVPSWTKAVELFQYGRHIVISSIVEAVQARADQMIIVAMVGDAALGLYYVAARIPEVLVFGLNGVITRVVFPTYSNLAQDREKLLHAYRTTIAASTTLVAPISLGLAASSSLVVLVVFGEDWAAAGPVLLLLIAAGIPQTLSWSSGDVFKATGKPQYQWIMMAIESIVVIPAMAVVAKLTGNITWVAATMLAGEIFSGILRIWTLKRVSGIPVMATFSAASRPLASALLMALAVYLFSTANPLGQSPLLLLLTTILLGAITYAATLLVIDRENLANWRRSVFHSDE